MSHPDKFEQDVVERQMSALRLGKNKYGLSPDKLEAETDISSHTWKSYFKGTKMPSTNLMRYLELVPDEFGSRFFKPIGRIITTPKSSEDARLEELLSKCAGYTHDHIERASDGIICHVDKAALADRAHDISIIATKIGKDAA